MYFYSKREGFIGTRLGMAFSSIENDLSRKGEKAYILHFEASDLSMKCMCT